MTDHEKVYEDGKMFLRRLQRHLERQSELSDAQKSFRRITVAEPQGEGHGNSWHLHILLIFEDTAPFISNGIMAELWNYGITDTHKVYDAEVLALYFKAYLSDVEYTAEAGKGGSGVKTVEKLADGVSKQFIKGERLRYYPTGMPLFTSSRGMRRSVVEKVSNQEAEERVSDCKMVYRETFVIGEVGCGNIVDKRYYKKR